GVGYNLLEGIQTTDCPNLEQIQESLKVVIYKMFSMVLLSFLLIAVKDSIASLTKNFLSLFDVRCYKSAEDTLNAAPGMKFIKKQLGYDAGGSGGPAMVNVWKRMKSQFGYK